MTTQKGESPTDEGIEHLQAAAREMVSAARSFLDAVEGVVSDKDRMSAAVGTVTDLLESAGESLGVVTDRMARNQPTCGTDDPSGDEGRVTRIDLD